MRSQVCSFLILVSLVPTIGCISAARNRDAKWKKYYTKVYIDPISKEISAKATFDFPCPTGYKTDVNTSWLHKARCYMHSADETSPHKLELRNAIIEEYVAMVNHAYGDFEHESVYKRAGVATGFDFINLGLTASTSVFGLARELGATATATQGAQHSIDTNFYNSQTAFAINKEMEALRLEELSKIRKRETERVNCDDLPAANTTVPAANGSQLTCYSLEEALGDVQDLFLAGTMHKALQSMSSNAATRADTAKKDLKTPNTQTANPPPR